MQHSPLLFMCPWRRFHGRHKQSPAMLLHSEALLCSKRMGCSLDTLFRKRGNYLFWPSKAAKASSQESKPSA